MKSDGDENDSADDGDHDEQPVIQPSANSKPRKTGFQFNLKKIPKKILMFPSRTTKPKSKPDDPKKATRGRKAKDAGTNPHHIYGEYIPQNFLERSKLFREEKKEQGYSASEARALWKNSRERAELLSMVPLQELKRRRFVDKTCQVNPFRAALGGS